MLMSVALATIRNILQNVSIFGTVPVPDRTLVMVDNVTLKNISALNIPRKSNIVFKLNVIHNIALIVTKSNANILLFFNMVKFFI